MSNKTYIRNTATLFAAMAVTKIVGAVFKIPLANILGGTGMGYFSAAYSIYSPVFALTAAGVPTVMIRLTAQNMALGRRENAAAVRRTAMLLFTLIGAAGMIIIWLLSGYFAAEIACCEESRPAIIAIAPAVLFCCSASVIRGYYEGMSNVIPTAAANVTEAVSRAVIGLSLSCGVIAAAKYCFDNGIPFLGSSFNTYDEAYCAALPVAAASAILAVTASELCALLALIFGEKRSKKQLIPDAIPCDSRSVIIRDIFRNLLPIAAFALVMNCFSFVDLLTVTRTIDRSIAMYPDFFAREFRDVFSSGVTDDQLANFMYGSYSGIAMSLFMLIPSFAAMTEKTSVPEITAAWERQDGAALREKVEFLIKACSLIGMPACMGAAVMAEPVLTMLYPSRTAEVAVCVDCFRALAAGGMFMVITSAVSGVFQAIGKGHIPLLIMSGAVVVKAALNPLLCAIPQINITGAAVSTVICYILSAAVSVAVLKRYVRNVSFLRPSFIPFISACACAVTAFFVFCRMEELVTLPISTVFSVFSAAFVYGLLLISTGCFRTSLIRKQFIQKIYSKGLAKKHKMG